MVIRVNVAHIGLYIYSSNTLGEWGRLGYKCTFIKFGHIATFGNIWAQIYISKIGAHWNEGHIGIQINISESEAHLGSKCCRKM